MDVCTYVCGLLYLGYLSPLSLLDLDLVLAFRLAGGFGVGWHGWVGRCILVVRLVVYLFGIGIGIGAIYIYILATS